MKYMHHMMLTACVTVLLLMLLPPFGYANQIVRVGYEQNHPMASTADNGSAQGIMIDLVEEVARREGWTIQYAPCVWNECLENLENAEIDLLVGIAHTPERAQKYNYNQHTIISNWGLLYSRQGLKIESYADLNGKRIAVVKNDVYCNTFIKMLQQFNIRCDLVYADSFRDVFDMIDWGEVDAGVANRFFSLLNERSFKVKPTPIIFSPVSVQVAAPKGKNQNVLAAFDRHLEAMKKDRNSVYHQSLKYWLGIEGAGYRMPRWLLWSLGGGVGGALLLGVFAALLRREVLRKTADLNHQVEERRKLFAAVEQSANSVVITDTHGIIEYVNPHFCMVTGYCYDEVIGQKPSLLKSGKQPPELYAGLWQTILAGHEWRGEFCNKRKNGTLYWDLCSIAPIRNDAGEITNFIAVKEDITTRKAHEEALNWQASHDSLTGLYNRYYLENHLSTTVKRLGVQQTLSLLLIDIDNLKFVNDTFGHDFGDLLLIEAAKRLKQLVSEDSVVGRFLGDEFFLVAPLSRDRELAVNLAHQVKRLLSELFVVEEVELAITVSIGLVIYPDDGEEEQNLLRNAEAALHEAKRLGRNTIVCYTSDFHRQAHYRLMLASRLHRALENEEFSLQYQPQLCLTSGLVVGVEALLRWECPDLAPVGATEFIPILEETGLIVPVGTWVLQQACRQAVSWQRSGMAALRLSVNISALQFQRGDLAETVRQILAESGLDPALLCLELTESMLMIDTAHAKQKLQELRDLGVSLSLDDFGTGYSSLAYLSRLPVQELKVDRSFVHRLHKTPSDTAVVNTIIAMAQELGLDLIAEGVETEEQQQHLLARGCTVIQGFLFSTPLPPDELATFINRRGGNGAHL
ncbi:MAG: EAL domain-containing protein [Geobacteraceae bacterium]|nr:EAL domain-containing protein [Geobacteraceae bacterium]